MQLLKQTRMFLQAPTDAAAESHASSSVVTPTSAASSTSAANIISSVPTQHATLLLSQQQQPVTLYLNNAPLEVLKAWVLWSGACKRFRNTSHQTVLVGWESYLEQVRKAK